MNHQSSKAAVGFVGLGVMGAPMSLNLLHAGYPLIVHDRRAEVAQPLLAGGAHWAPSPRELALQVDVIVSCLPSVEAIESVALGDDGLLPALRPGHVHFETSTGSIDLARRLQGLYAPRGAQFLDAPVSGGARGAQEARLAIWVGGDRSSFDRHLDILQTMGSHVLHVGELGAGLVTKLVNNCASQSLQAAVTECFMLGVKAGADPLALWEAMRQSVVGRRRSYDMMISEFLPGVYDPPKAALRIVHKDVHLATALAQEVGVPMPMAQIAQADLDLAMARGWGERDRRSVMLLPQERAGVQVKADRAAIQAVLARDPVASTDVENWPGI